VDSGREILTFKGHSNNVEAVAFSPYGKLALSGSRDSTTRLWNIQTGKEVAKMVGFENGEWVTITPKGS
jgi:WD40 repeat protein